MRKIQRAFFMLGMALYVVAPSVAVGDGFDMDKTTTAGKDAGLVNEPIFDTITYFMNWLLGLVGVLGVIAFVISGVLYLTSAGDEKQAEKAKEIMTNAIIGLVVALIGLIVVNAVAGLTGAADAGIY